jgi:hypothetical protein
MSKVFRILARSAGLNVVLCSKWIIVMLCFAALLPFDSFEKLFMRSLRLGHNTSLDAQGRLCLCSEGDLGPPASASRSMVPSPGGRCSTHSCAIPNVQMQYTVNHVTQTFCQVSLNHCLQLSSPRGTSDPQKWLIILASKGQKAQVTSPVLVSFTAP